MARRVIVNADDLGWSTGVTDGIFRACRAGILTSATLAANMPDAERAASLAAAEDALGIGVHLNACQGPPLSDAGASLADADGVMRSTAPELIVRCVKKPWLIRAVLAEFDAQIRWVLDHGLSVTHLDSHRHVHAFPPVYQGVVRLAKRYGIASIRWPREKLPSSGFPAAPQKQAKTTRLLNRMCNLNILMGRPQRRTLGLWGVAHTGRIDVAWLTAAANAAPEGVLEIMTHPGFIDGLDPAETRLIASRKAELDALCDPAVREAFERNRLELIHYGHIR